MGYKRIGEEISFADLAISKSLEHNRSIKLMDSFRPRRASSPEGIPSDPELENQINDRISFKKFLGLSMDKPSPDHSTFSRFRKRLSKEVMIQLNNVVLQEFAKRGLSINEGIASGLEGIRSSN